MSVRAFEFESLRGLDTLVPSSKDSKLTVWVTACLGTQLLCRQKGFLGTTIRDETTDTSGDTTPSHHAVGRQKLAIDSVFKIHGQKRQGASIKEGSVHSGHRSGCHERDGACSWATYKAFVTKAMSEGQRFSPTIGSKN